MPNYKLIFLKLLNLIYVINNEMFFKDLVAYCLNIIQDSTENLYLFHFHIIYHCFIHILEKGIAIIRHGSLCSKSPL